MALDFDGSTEYVNHAAQVLAPGNMSMACWANSDTDDGNERTLVALSHSTTSNRVARLQTGPAASPPQLYTQVINNAVGINHRSTVATAIPQDTWYHACGTFTSASSVITYLNGVAGSAVQTISGAIATTNSMQCGALNFGGSILQYFDGSIAEVGLWDVVLTAAEVLVLSKGYSPQFVRPGNLVGYWPLMGRIDPEPDIWGAKALTLVNGPTQIEHVRIIYPRGMRRFARAFVIAPTQITGTAAIVFSPSADLNARGLLSGTTSVTFVGAADLNAFAALVGSSPFAFTTTADLNALGALVGNVPLVFTASADIMGRIPASGTIPLTFTVTAQLAPTGAMAGDTSFTFLVNGNLTVLGASIWIELDTDDTDNIWTPIDTDD